MQLAEVMPFKRLGEIAEELEELGGRLIRQFQRDTHDRQIIGSMERSLKVSSVFCLHGI
jgi:hypothetical protein